ncbi:MAG: RNAase [Ignavibacteriaceae bacterium]|nr:RNAase [Ignavibacteriaceae bacterium]
MSTILSRNTFFVKEHPAVFKAAKFYDIYNPDTSEMIMTCREANLGFFTKIMRFSDARKMTPFHLQVDDTRGNRIVSVKRGFTWFVSVVEVFDAKDVLIGRFRQKLFSIGGRFELFDAQDNHVLTLRGKFTSWEFKLLRDGVEFATISKQWAGLAREMFTSADNYMIQISDRVPAESPLRPLIIAAAMCIDLVLKE